MHFKIKTWLYDIHKSIEEIEDFTNNITQYNVFSEDLKTIRAIERNLTIIGEASNRIRKEDQEIARRIGNIKDIIDTRDRISHGYEFVSKNVLWDIIQNDLPVLKKEVSTLLEKS